MKIQSINSSVNFKALKVSANDLKRLSNVGYYLPSTHDVKEVSELCCSPDILKVRRFISPFNSPEYKVFLSTEELKKVDKMNKLIIIRKSNKSKKKSNITELLIKFIKGAEILTVKKITKIEKAMKKVTEEHLPLFS